MENLKRFSSKGRILFGLLSVAFILFYYYLVSFTFPSLGLEIEFEYFIAGFFYSYIIFGLGVAFGLFRYQSEKYFSGIYVFSICFVISLMTSYGFFFEVQKETLLLITTVVSVLGVMVYFIEARMKLKKAAELKEISLEELIMMTDGKTCYNHGRCSARSRENFLNRLVVASDFVVSDFKNFGSLHYIFSENKEHYIDNVKIVFGNCVKSTPLSKFYNNQTCKLRVGDPYEIEGTIKGIFNSRFELYLIIETNFKDFLLARVDCGKVRHLEILK